MKILTKLKKGILLNNMIIKYCIRKRLPLIKTYRNCLFIKRKKATPIRFLIKVDFFHNKDTIMLNEDYFDIVFLLNHKENLYMFRDKTILIKTHPELLGRNVILLDESSEKERDEFINSHDIFVGKIKNGLAGQKFIVYDKQKMSIEQIQASIKNMNQTILEEYILQHDDILKIYPHSVNTIRIHTVSNGTEIKTFFQPKMRFGCDGSNIDMIGKNGSYRVVLNDDGTIRYSVYISKNGDIQKAEEHHNSHIKFKHVKIPYVKEAKELCIKAAGFYPELPYLSWDVAITKKGPIIVEGNSISGCFTTYQTINFLYNGKGLKKEIIEMLEYGLNRKLS